MSRLVAELIDRGLVREVGLVGRAAGGAGPATLLELDGRHVAALGLELNVDFITAIAIDLGGRVIFQRTRAIDAAERSASPDAAGADVDGAPDGRRRRAELRHHRRHHGGGARARRRGRQVDHLRAEPPLDERGGRQPSRPRPRRDR